MDLFSLKDKVIAITGGTGVLGSSFVHAVANAVGTVIVMGRNEIVANEHADKIKREGGKAIMVL